MTRIAPRTRQNARRLRREATPQEVRLWRELRDLNRRLGLNFRRQAAIGPYIADFADLGRQLLIEVDGGQHGGPDDAMREDWLSSQGFDVLRFWNNQIDRNLESVMQIILDAIEAAPPPHPSPTRGKGGAQLQTVSQGQKTSASPPPRGEGMGVGGAVPGNQS